MVAPGAPRKVPFRGLAFAALSDQAVRQSGCGFPLLNLRFCCARTLFAMIEHFRAGHNRPIASASFREDVLEPQRVFRSAEHFAGGSGANCEPRSAEQAFRSLAYQQRGARPESLTSLVVWTRCCARLVEFIGFGPLHLREHCRGSISPAEWTAAVWVMGGAVLNIVPNMKAPKRASILLVISLLQAHRSRQTGRPPNQPSKPNQQNSSPAANLLQPDLPNQPSQPTLPESVSLNRPQPDRPPSDQPIKRSSDCPSNKSASNLSKPTSQTKQLSLPAPLSNPHFPRQNTRLTSARPAQFRPHTTAG